MEFILLTFSSFILKQFTYIRNVSTTKHYRAQGRDGIDEMRQDSGKKNVRMSLEKIV